MERKVWRRPLTEVQKFEANEYVAACEGENRVYKFTCDAGWTGLTGSTVYTNGPDVIVATNDDVELGGYHKCGQTHEASTSDDFIPGYLRKNILGIPAGEIQEVIIWRGEDGNNIHCTKNLRMDSWPIERS